ncbi:hypothetical protein KOXY103107_12675 [Komagataeibacter xylinus]
MQAHDFHEHLVGIGRAIEGTGARRVVGFGFRIHEFVLAHLALGIKLADALLLAIGQARGHGAGGNEDGGQVAKAQRAHEQAGHDLVAYAQHGNAFIHAMAQPDGSGQRNDIAAEQRDFHARLALGHAIAHGGRATGHLRRAAYLTREQLDLVGVAGIGLMGGEHVVIGGDDAYIHAACRAQARLVAARGRNGMGQVAAGQAGAADAVFTLAGNQVQIGPAGAGRTGDDPLGHGGQDGVQAHGISQTLKHLRRVVPGQARHPLHRQR